MYALNIKSGLNLKTSSQAHSSADHKHLSCNFAFPHNNKMNNSQSQFSGSSSSTTVGQLFDKTVDKMMSDKSFKSSMESNMKANSWPSGGGQVR